MKANREKHMQAAERVERYSHPMEHRWGQRVTLEIPVRLQIAGRTLGHGVLRDASISGGLIETALELRVFNNLVVCLRPVGESTHGAPDLPACVVRRTPTGFAVEWRDMACPAIVALLERATGREVAALVEDEPFCARKKAS
jgi:hypothetical protein